ncbi:MAG: hypothetical protein QOE45_3170 [Frankiaceae bacterium]|nr:hypothetical protein [Frankiaceae bacterium]
MRRLALLLSLALAAPAHAVQPPVCAAAPGLNDRCEKWVAQPAETPRFTGVAAAPAGDKVYAVGTDTRGRMTVTAYDAARGTALWTGRPSTPLPTAGTAVAVSADGRAVFAVGTISLRPDLNSRPFDYFLTMRFDAKTGRALWAAVYRGVGANGNAPTGLAVSPRGDRVYVTGWSERTGPYQVLPKDWATLAYDARTGGQVWVRRYAGLAGGRNEPIGVTLSPRGDRVYVTGLSEHPTQSPTAIFDMTVIGYSAAGTARWTQRTPGFPVGVAQRGDRVYVGGGLTSGGGRVVAYDGARGTKVATMTLPGAPGALAVSPDEKRVYVATTAAAATGASAVATLGIAVAAYDRATGRAGWTTTFAPQGATFAQPVAIATNARGDRVYALGVAGPAFNTTYPVVVGLTDKGATSWVARYDVREPNAPGTGAGLAVSGSRVFAAGAAAPLLLTGTAHGLLLAYEG